ncbi:leucine-rich repeat-containing protein [Tanacetum coccineum]
MIDMREAIVFKERFQVYYDDCELLQGLILKGNQLEGEVPSSLSKCQSLKVVDFGNNHLNGTFPRCLEDLPNLQALVLKSNNFHGHIQPSSTDESPFPSLQILDLSHNGFVGQLLAKYFQIFNSMKNVVKSSTTPEYLYMGGNYYSFIVALIGPNPTSLGNLIEIESLDLSWNQLSGEIPQSLARITALEVSMVSIAQTRTSKFPQLKNNGEHKRPAESGFTWKGDWE